MYGLTRRQAREIAFQFLYGYLPDPAPANNSGISFNQDDFRQFCMNFGNSLDQFSWEIVEGTEKNLPELDVRISELAAKSRWKLERMGRVDLTVLRMAAFELLYRKDIPRTVAINEAVELSKRFGTEDSAAFVNGILDNFTKPA